MTRDEEAMRLALAEAELALSTGDVPVAAVLLDADGAVIATARNEREKHQDPTAHAEVVAIRRAAEIRGDWRLTDTTLVVTLEPCVLCAGAILAARIPRVVFGAWDEKAGRRRKRLRPAARPPAQPPRGGRRRGARRRVQPPAVRLLQRAVATSQPLPAEQLSWFAA